MIDRPALPSPRDFRALVDEFPLAWIISINAVGDVLSSQLPLLPLAEEGGTVTTLLGHMSRNNPLVARLRNRSRATILFQGPHAYASPSWYSNRDSAPTWLYVNATCVVDISLREDLTDNALDRLVERMENGRPDRWHIAEIGSRYALLRQRVIAFIATIHETKTEFKLGQTESSEVVRDTIGALRSHGLVDWLQAFNAERLE